MTPRVGAGRDDRAFCSTLSDKARTIGGSVLDVILSEERR